MKLFCRKHVNFIFPFYIKLDYQWIMTSRWGIIILTMAHRYHNHKNLSLSRMRKSHWLALNGQIWNHSFPKTMYAWQKSGLEISSSSCVHHIHRACTLEVKKSTMYAFHKQNLWSCTLLVYIILWHWINLILLIFISHHSTTYFSLILTIHVLTTLYFHFNYVVTNHGSLYFKISIHVAIFFYSNGNNTLN